MMKRGWVGSGGGLRYFWHLGALQYQAEHGHDFDYFVGTSAGALAAVTAAGAKRRWGSLWGGMAQASLAARAIKHPDNIVAGPWFRPWGYVQALRGRGMYRLTPLAQRLVNLIGLDPDEVLPDAAVTITNLTDGRLLVLPASITRAVISATVPVLSPGQGPEKDLVDGGVRMFAPLKPAIEAGCDDITVQVTRPQEMPPSRRLGDGLAILSRTLDLMSHQMMVEDVQYCELVNARVRAGLAPDKRLVNLHLIYADDDLPRATPDQFNHQTVLDLLNKGFRDAQAQR